MKLWTITTSQADDETRTEIHTNEADAVAHHARIVAASWQSWFGEDKPMPDDTEEAWGILTCQPGFFDTVDLFVHEVAIDDWPLVRDLLLSLKVAAAALRAEFERNRGHAAAVLWPVPGIERSVTSREALEFAHSTIKRIEGGST